MIWVRWCLLKSIMKKKFKNGISLITIPVPIVCVFQGCVISSCWYFAQALLRILITACLISLFFLALIERYDPLEIAAAMFFISATERPWEGIWIDYFFGGEERGAGVQGGKTSCASFCAYLIADSRRAFLTAFVLNEVHEVRTFAPCKAFLLDMFAFFVAWKLLWIQNNQC